MVDRTPALALTKQADAVGISRSSVYDLPRPVSTADLLLAAAVAQDCAAHSSLGHGYHLHSDGQGVGLPGGGYRRVDAAGARVASVDFAGDERLPGGRKRRLSALDQLYFASGQWLSQLKQPPRIHF